MLIPRRIQLEQANDLQCFHLWSPVVPGLAALAGTELKKWIAKLLRRLSGAYAVRLQGFSIEADQLHLIVQWTPGLASQWSAGEVTRRWRAAHPMPAAEASDPNALPPLPVDLAKARVRLASLSAFLQQFKQLITFKFNRETKHKGTIWRGRFRLAVLTDASAVAGALSFIDLLPVAKDKGARPEESPFSSLHARVALYKGKFGNTPYEPLAEPDGLWQPFPPEVAAELREGEEAAASMPGMEPAPMMPPTEMPGMGTMPPVTMPGMQPAPMMPPTEMPGMGTMPPVTMPGMQPAPMMPPTEMPGMGMMPTMTMPMMPMTPPDMPQVTDPAGGSWAGEPDPPKPWVNSALREDGPGGVLSWLSLRQYLGLLDSLVAKAKAWPHLPASAPGRAPAPETPAWESTAQAALGALGLSAQTFTAQWQRLAKLRV